MATETTWKYSNSGHFGIPIAARWSRQLWWTCEHAIQSISRDESVHWIIIIGYQRRAWLTWRDRSHACIQISGGISSAWSECLMLLSSVHVDFSYMSARRGAFVVGYSGKREKTSVRRRTNSNYWIRTVRIAFTIESHPMNLDRICDHLVMNFDP
jgi:hypothetical protein